MDTSTVRESLAVFAFVLVEEVADPLELLPQAVTASVRQPPIESAVRPDLRRRCEGPADIRASIKLVVKLREGYPN